MWNSEDELHDFVGTIYDASYSPEKWFEVLSIVAEAVKAESALLVYRDKAQPRSNILTHYGGGKELLELYSSRFKGMLSRSAPLATVTAEHQIVQEHRELANLFGELYTGFTIPFDHHHIGGVLLLDDGDRSLILTLQRSQNEGPYKDVELSKLQLIAPHIERAVRIHGEFSRLRHRRQILNTVLDQLVVGLILLNSSGQLVYANPLAKQIVRGHPALEISANRLRATGKEDDIRFQAWIRDCLSSKRKVSSVGSVFGLRHFESDLPLSVLVTPANQINGLVQSGMGQEAVAVFISDPASDHPISIEALMMAFDLTRREAEVAIALANGQKIADIAESAGTTLNTVRTQLKSIFSKTNTNRQTQLIKLLLTGPFNLS